MMPTFSIIMPSYLGTYKGAAGNRREKLIRAIDSVIAQTFTSWELLICADGCKETFDLVCDLYGDRANIDCYLIDKQPFLSPNIRNYPISQARGEYVIYLDSDDYFGMCHLRNVAAGLNDCNWAMFDDLIPTNTGWKPRKAIYNRGGCGTSNIVHKRSLPVAWVTPQYGYDDWNFIQALHKHTPRINYITGGQYHVCHIPNRFDI